MHPVNPVILSKLRRSGCGTVWGRVEMRVARKSPPKCLATGRGTLYFWPPDWRCRGVPAARSQSRM